MNVEVKGAGQLRKGVLGLGFIVFFVVSAAGPLTALAGGFPLGMLLGNGAGIPALIGLAMVVLILFSVGYTTMARYVTNAGGFYSSATRGLGGVAGGAAGYLALLGYNTMQIGLYGLFGVAVTGLVAPLGLTAPWWVWSFVAMAIIGFCGYRQIDLSAKILGGLVVAEYLIVLVLDGFILAKGGAHGVDLSAFSPSVVFSGSPFIGVLFCFAAFVGFEATTIYSEEAKNPRKTIPLATYIAVILIGVFYLFSTWCMSLGAGNPELVKILGGLGDPTTFLFVLSDQYAGSAVTLILHVFFVTSVFAGLLAFHNSSARYFFSLGREGLLPARFGKTHGVHQSPHLGSLLQSVLAVVVVTAFVLSGVDPVLSLFSWLTNVSTLCILALMALAALAVVVFFTKEKGLAEPAFKVKVLPAVSGVILLAILILAIANFSVLTGADPVVAWLLVATLPVAAVVGVLVARNLKKNNAEAYQAIGQNRSV